MVELFTIDPPGGDKCTQNKFFFAVRFGGTAISVDPYQ
jgi:hypothetical protein